nr:hypothetical protein [Tanacetum cinerariifolium]
IDGAAHGGRARGVGRAKIQVVVLARSAEDLKLTERRPQTQGHVLEALVVDGAIHRARIALRVAQLNARQQNA